MPIAKISTPIQKLMRAVPRSRGAAPDGSAAGQGGDAVPGPALGIEDVRHVSDVPHVVLVQHLREGVDDTGETQPTGDERVSPVSSTPSRRCSTSTTWGTSETCRTSS